MLLEATDADVCFSQDSMVRRPTLVGSFQNGGSSEATVFSIISGNAGLSTVIQARRGACAKGLWQIRRRPEHRRSLSCGSEPCRALLRLSQKDVSDDAVPGMERQRRLLHTNCPPEQLHQGVQGPVCRLALVHLHSEDPGWDTAPQKLQAPRLQAGQVRKSPRLQVKERR